METPDGQNPSTDSVMPPLLLPFHTHHNHNHHQILLPFHTHHNHNHHHHHHHLVMLPHCCAIHGFVPPPNGPPFARPIAAPIPETSTDLQPSLCDLEIQSSQLFEEQQEDAYEELGEEAEDDPIFVLTDEWRDLFAKSEAKRREAKKQARKQGKK